jgi:hypothetical protein
MEARGAGKTALARSTSEDGGLNFSALSAWAMDFICAILLDSVGETAPRSDIGLSPKAASTNMINLSFGRSII